MNRTLVRATALFVSAFVSAGEPRLHAGRTAAEWVAAIRSPKFVERMRSSAVINSLVLDEDATVALATGLFDPNPEVRDEVFVALRERWIGHPRAVAVVLAALTGTVETRRAASRVLPGSQERENHPAVWRTIRKSLLDWSKSADPSMRAAAGRAFAAAGDFSPGDALPELNDPEAAVRSAAVEGLEVSRPSQEFPGAVAERLVHLAVADPDATVRDRAAAILGSESSDDLAVHLKSPDAAVRRRAARILLRTQADPEIAGLPAEAIGLVSDADSLVREAAVGAAAANPAGITALCRALASDPVAYVRLRAAYRLLESAGVDPRAQAALTNAVRTDASDEVRCRIAEGLPLPVADRVALFTALLRGSGSYDAASALSRCGRAGVDALLETLATGPESARRTAAFQLLDVVEWSKDSAAGEFAPHLWRAIAADLASADLEVRRHRAELLLKGRRAAILDPDSATVRIAEATVRTPMTVASMLSIVAQPTGRRNLGAAGVRSGRTEVDDRLLLVRLRGGYVARARDEATLLAALRDPTAHRYARLCAARFLLDLDSVEARRYVDSCIASRDSRSAVNGVWAILNHVEGPAQAWGVRRLIELSGDRRLDDFADEPLPRFDDPAFPEGDVWDHRAPTRAVIRDVLADIGGADAVVALSALLAADPERHGTVMALERVGGDAAARALAATLIGRDGRFRESQQRALERMRWPPYLITFEAKPIVNLLDVGGQETGVLELLRQLEIEMRSNGSCGHLIERLGETRDRRATGPILRAAEKSYWACVGAIGVELRTPPLPVVQALLKIGGDEAIRGLVGMLEWDPKVGAEADDGLQMTYKSRSIYVRLERDGVRPYFPEAVGDALELLTGRPLGTDAAAWRAWLAKK